MHNSNLISTVQGDSLQELSLPTEQIELENLSFAKFEASIYT